LNLTGKARREYHEEYHKHECYEYENIMNMKKILITVRILSAGCVFAGRNAGAGSSGQGAVRISGIPGKSSGGIIPGRGSGAYTLTIELHAADNPDDFETRIFIKEFQSGYAAADWNKTPQAGQ
jgi:hypothetical protein